MRNILTITFILIAITHYLNLSAANANANANAKAGASVWYACYEPAFKDDLNW